MCYQSTLKSRTKGNERVISFRISTCFIHLFKALWQHCSISTFHHYKKQEDFYITNLNGACWLKCLAWGSLKFFISFTEGRQPPGPFPFYCYLPCPSLFCMCMLDPFFLLAPLFQLNISILTLHRFTSQLRSSWILSFTSFGEPMNFYSLFGHWKWIILVPG